ncbi:MAG: PAM68 family protein [Thermostichales cyanobacterium BF4_bins_65]
MAKKKKARPTDSPANPSVSVKTPYVPPLPEERSNYIPPEVSNRMVRRVFFFAGIPTALGLSSFVVNYLLIVNHVVKISNLFTLVESLSLFGLGFVGISYGVLSASWEEAPGSLWGVGEFRQNLGNLWQAWREYSRQKRQDS